MELPICDHIKMGGGRCGSPALSGQQYCHFHAAMHRTVPTSNLFVRMWNPGHEHDPRIKYQWPYLEDAESVQIGFMQLIHGVAQELLDPRRAKVILSALHGAASNLRQMKSAEEEGQRRTKKRAGSVRATKTLEERLREAEDVSRAAVSG